MAFSGPLSKIELRLSCHKLRNMDIMSKSDPQVHVSLKSKTGQWVEIGRTEVIMDNLNPQWVTPIVVDYYFEEIQQLKFSVFDVDKHSSDFIVSSKGRMVTAELNDLTKPGKSCGTLTVVAEELKDVSSIVRLQFRGSKLDKKDFFGKSDPYFVIERPQDTNVFVPVYKSEILKKTLDPTWREFTIPLQVLGEKDRPILFQCYDWNSNGKDELIGEAHISLQQLIDSRRFELKNKKGKHAGNIETMQVDVVKEHTFLEYLAGGCDVSLIVAIDFTASNGNPTDPSSLHYTTGLQPLAFEQQQHQQQNLFQMSNEYQKAIMAVGEILLPYDSDGMIPVYGFGAKLPPLWEVSHCFPLNGNPSNPEVLGVRGILDAYQQAISNVQLYGPTNFAPVINTSAVIASRHNTQQQQKYFILLIITDGEITDMDDTIEAIVRGSSLPLSIIIVGVGSANFENMQILDGDEKALRSKGQTAERDIVQFVAFRDYKQRLPADLAADTLREVPQQFMAYMKAHRIVPNPPRQYQPQPSAPL